MSNARTKIVIPSLEEDAVINAGIPVDPDTFELDDEWFANAKSSAEAVPHILERHRRTRASKSRLSRKTSISGWTPISSSTFATVERVGKHA
jgi:hypothetical protein